MPCQHKAAAAAPAAAPAATTRDDPLWPWRWRRPRCRMGAGGLAVSLRHSVQKKESFYSSSSLVLERCGIVRKVFHYKTIKTKTTIQMMLNTAESAGEREAGGDPAHLSERRRCQLAMSKRWTEELEKGTTSRSNLTAWGRNAVFLSRGLRRLFILSQMGGLVPAALLPPRRSRKRKGWIRRQRLWTH